MQDGKSSWEAKYTKQFIEKERDTYEKIHKIDIWYRERMCMAISPESQIFKKEYFRYFTWKDLRLSDLNIYMTVDLAISQKKTADYTAIMVVGVNKDNHWFILDCSFGRFDPSDTIDEIFKMIGKWSPQKVGVEKVAYQAALSHFLMKEMPKRNMFFTVTQLKAQRRKEERISALQPRFTAGSVWVPENAGDWWTELMGEMLAFPNGIHDDLLDALAYVEQISVTPVKKKYMFNNTLYAGAM